MAQSSPSSRPVEQLYCIRKECTRERDIWERFQGRTLYIAYFQQFTTDLWRCRTTRSAWDADYGVIALRRVILSLNAMSPSVRKDRCFSRLSFEALQDCILNCSQRHVSKILAVELLLPQGIQKQRDRSRNLRFLDAG